MKQLTCRILENELLLPTMINKELQANFGKIGVENNTVVDLLTD